MQLNTRWRSTEKKSVSKCPAKFKVFQNWRRIEIGFSAWYEQMVEVENVYWQNEQVIK